MNEPGVKIPAGIAPQFMGTFFHRDVEKALKAGNQLVGHNGDVTMHIHNQKILRAPRRPISAWGSPVQEWSRAKSMLILGTNSITPRRDLSLITTYEKNNRTSVMMERARGNRSATSAGAQHGHSDMDGPSAGGQRTEKFVKLVHFHSETEND